MTKKFMAWRLPKLPTGDEISNLVKEKVITPEEARQMLFSSEEKTDRDVKSLEEEIKFLRELVEKLAQSSEIVKMVKDYYPVYIEKYPWYEPYYTWSHSGNMVLRSTGTTDINNFSSITTW